MKNYKKNMRWALESYFLTEFQMTSIFAFALLGVLHYYLAFKQLVENK